MSTRQPRIIRQNAMDEEELKPLLKDIDKINSSTFYSVVNRWFGLSPSDIQEEIPICNNILTIFGIIVGLLMFVRGLIDGKLSMIGSWLRLVYFGFLSISYAMDERLEEDRWSFLTPALSGLALTVAQLIGMFITDGPFECDSFLTCL